MFGIFSNHKTINSWLIVGLGRLVVWDSNRFYTQESQSLSFLGIPGIQTTGTQINNEPLADNKSPPKKKTSYEPRN